MTYKLHELKQRIPGVAGDRESKPVPPLSPDLQRKLNLTLAIQEGYSCEPGAEPPRTMAARAQLAIDDFRRVETAQEIGQIGLAADTE